MAVADFLIGEPAHLIMQARQFANLRHRVRAGENAPTGPSIVSDPAR
ncbi:hypothetical protein [Nocardia beijingensis]